MKNENRKSQIANLKSRVGALAKVACGIRALRLHPKFRWLNYACPILKRRTSAVRPPSSDLVPPAGPPKLRLRKRRRLSVHSTNHPQR
jgi:hypothetical protein